LRAAASITKLLALIALGALVAGCAHRPVNPPIAIADRSHGYRPETRALEGVASDTIIVLAFSGGGTRAAAFGYGVLEELRRTELVVGGRSTRLLDEVDIITGVSGGSFTALAYGLYGESLFADYPERFLKRDVQGELVRRVLNPVRWPALASEGYGRSEVASELYDEILFHGATFADLQQRKGPAVIVAATDLSSGARMEFAQSNWDALCSDLSAVPLSRAAAASSAVPLVLSPVTIDNYGGTCNYTDPGWVRSLRDPRNHGRPAGRAVQRSRELASFQDGVHRPYLHLVDGGFADNLGMRSVLEGLEQLEASHAARGSTRLDPVRRVVVFVVNAVSAPRTRWDESERPPNDFLIVLQAAGVPIDRYSHDAVELLRDIVTRWSLMRRLRGEGLAEKAGDATLAQVANVPDIELYTVEVRFDALDDAAERAYLNDLPTSFVLEPGAVDRLRQAAGRIVREAPELRRFLHDVAATPASAPRPASPP
jgi:NTE family protein